MSAPSDRPASPILDLTYRNYDGPLEPPTYRWWPIAKLMIRQTFKKKGYWMWGLASGIWYAILMAVFWFWDTFSENLPRPPAASGAPNVDPARAFYNNQQWDLNFVNAFSTGQLFLFLSAMIIGAGVIANDNRANALLVYLSKPCDKRDYVIGKWMSIFLPITLVCAIPTVIFYFYCLLSYQQYGFVSQDPWLGLRLIPTVLLPGIFHASALVGISSLFKQARLAGATYAAIYFILLFFTKTMEARYRMGDAPKVVEHLYYASVDGLQIGLAKVFLASDGGPLFPGAGMISNQQSVPPAPNGWLFGAIFLAVCAGFLTLAWRRIRAVEVVG